MSDRELLESAARAAGIDHWSMNSPDGLVLGIDRNGPAIWNPLASDGDAFRLAVKLNLQLIVEDERCGCVTASWGDDYDNHVVEHSETPETAAAAARRAIVRAAAKIGELEDAPQNAG